MSFEEILESLDIEIDKRLYQLKQKELVNLLSELIKNTNKKTLSRLISDNSYFGTDDIIKALEKRSKALLFRILNEPGKEQNLRQPRLDCSNWGGG